MQRHNPDRNGLSLYAIKRDDLRELSKDIGGISCERGGYRNRKGRSRECI
ncbi:MAG TPA: hypothetical protein VFQ43_08655 [Nitrososphaera sp.]|nr:hypothetical protein [Nitrososphaera sp.]